MIGTLFGIPSKVDPPISSYPAGGGNGKEVQGQRRDRNAQSCLESRPQTTILKRGWGLMATQLQIHKELDGGFAETVRD